MLQPPKLRGDFGEFTLEQMLRDLLPAEHYECQASIGNGASMRSSGRHTARSASTASFRSITSGVRFRKARTDRATRP